MQRLVIHVAENFSKVFVARMIEWEHSFALVTFGLALILAPQLFETSTSYAAFRAVRPSADFWGMAAMVVGAMRLFVLALNGMVRRSPHVRAVFAALGALFWFLAALGGLVKGQISQASGLYVSFVVWEFVIFSLCIHYAKLEDLGVVKHARQADA